MRSIPAPFSAAVPVLLTIFVVVVLLPAPLRGQTAPFRVELRGGATAPLQELADREASWAGETGPAGGFGISFAYNVAWYAAVYGGFSQLRFRCPTAGCGFDTRLVSTGFDFGARFIFGTGPVVPWIRTGLLSYRVEGSVPGDEGPTAVTSARALGAEAGAGLTLRLTDRLTLAPGIRYSRLTPDFRKPGPLPMRYLVADVGLVLGF